MIGTLPQLRWLPLLLVAFALLAGSPTSAHAWKALPSHDWFAARCPYIDESSPPTDPYAFAKRNVAIHCMANQVRQYNGLAGLSANSVLNDYALKKVNLAKQCGVGLDPHRPCGYTGWPSMTLRTWSENFCKGNTGSPWNFMTAWWGSTYHRQALMDPYHRYQGIATGWAYIKEWGKSAFIAYHEMAS